jgi:hypothetical protein
VVKRLISLAVIGCLLGVSVQGAGHASQAAGVVEPLADIERLRIQVLPAVASGQPDDRVARGLRDGATDLQTRLGERLDPRIAEIVTDSGRPGLTVVVITREIIKDIYVVRAEVGIGSSRTMFAGTDEGTWRAAAGNLATNIAVWITANAATLRASIGDGATKSLDQLTPPYNPLTPLGLVDTSDWGLVVPRLKPGDEITITRLNRRSNVYFLGATQTLAVLNLSDVQMPASVRALLARVASTRPELFIARTGEEFRDGSASVRRDGAWLGARKIVDLSQIVEALQRTDVTEIKIAGHLSRNGSEVAKALLIAGGVIGFLLLRMALPRD